MHSTHVAPIRTFVALPRRLATAICLAAGLLLALPCMSAAATPAKTYAAKFAETRTIAGIDQPLVLHGVIRFTPGRHLLWAVKKPYQYRFEIADGKIMETLPGGSHHTKPLAKTPWAEALFKLFSALFGGEPGVLARYFDVASKPDGMVLTPRSAALAKWVTRIVAIGKPVPRRVTIFESGGNSTRLDFTPIGAIPKLPAPASAPAAASR